jgi:hypothetical protein
LERTDGTVPRATVLRGAALKRPNRTLRLLLILTAILLLPGHLRQRGATAEQCKSDDKTLRF